MKTTTTHQKIVQILNGGLLMVFLSIIFMPMIDQQLGLGLDKYVSTEKRTLTKKPAFQWDSIASYPSKYEAYFNDNFSFRNFFVKLHSYISAKTYGLSVIPDVLIGKEGWLYYVAKSQGNSLEDYRGLLRVDQGNLELIREHLEQRTAQLKVKGIRFLVVVVPDKQTIYPEYLPLNTERKNRYPTRLDQIVEYLKNQSSIQLLDVSEVLLQQKTKGPFPLYWKTDSHWNSFGGFLAYQQIMRGLSIEPKQRSDFRWEQVTHPSGDLAGMLAASDQYREENYISFTPLFKHNITFKDAMNSYGTYSVKLRRAINADSSLPKLLVFNDSFGEVLEPFLSLHFRETVFIGSQFSSVIIEQEKPDMVIMEVVERYAPSLAWGELK